ncbi:MAG: type III polyketide synthase [Bythopirellula sp.]|nr:type III polyketide synthase [Bythopirellula sp.]
MTTAILGMGTALPDAVIDKDDALLLARSLCNGTEEQETWLSAIYAGSGISTRRFCLGPQVVRDVIDGTNHSQSVFLPKKLPGDRGPTTAQRMELYTQLAPPLATSAARAAVQQAQIEINEITHVVTVSCTGFMAPGVDHALIESLGLSQGVERTHVGYMGCHGALNGLRVARAYVAAKPQARVLVSAVELCCLHYYYGWDPQKIIANALFADGAAAVIVGTATKPAESDWCLSATGSCLFSNSQNAMTWTIGDHGFEMTLSRQVPAIIAEGLRPWLENWLRPQGLSVEDIKSWAVHPGGPRILDAVEEALHLGSNGLATSREILAEYGNMSSPTTLFILDRMQQERVLRPCVALGFGPGLALEAALFM